MSGEKLDEIWNLLRSVDKKLDLHLQDEATLRPKLLELIDLLEHSKGAMRFIKLVVLIGAPLVAVVAWTKEHVRF